MSSCFSFVFFLVSTGSKLTSLLWFIFTPVQTITLSFGPFSVSFTLLLSSASSACSLPSLAKSSSFLPGSSELSIPLLVPCRPPCSPGGPILARSEGSDGLTSSVSSQGFRCLSAWRSGAPTPHSRSPEASRLTAFLSCWLVALPWLHCPQSSRVSAHGGESAFRGLPS